MPVAYGNRIVLVITTLKDYIEILIKC